MAANIHRHPAPNRALGELLPGWYDVPQNPIAAAQQGIKYTPTLGEIMPGSFVVPQNPMMNFTAGSVQPLAVAPGAPGQVNGQPVGKGSGNGVSGCGCGGSCGGCGGGGGMGDISSDLSQFMADLTAGNFTQAFTVDTILGFPSWFVVGGVAALGLYLFAGTGDSRAKRAYKTVRRKVAA
jgi:hypothetical protein